MAVPAVVKPTVVNAVTGMWSRVGLVRTDVSEERVASIFWVEKNSRENKSVSRLLTDPHGATLQTEYNIWNNL
jgi:hypothetical protein